MAWRCRIWTRILTRRTTRQIRTRTRTRTHQTPPPLIPILIQTYGIPPSVQPQPARVPYPTPTGPTTGGRRPKNDTPMRWAHAEELVDGFRADDAALTGVRELGGGCRACSLCRTIGGRGVYPSFDAAGAGEMAVWTWSRSRARAVANTWSGVPPQTPASVCGLLVGPAQRTPPIFGRGPGQEKEKGSERGLRDPV